MSCSDSCALFFKKKSVCVSDPCATVGLNCQSYGAGSDVYDCQSWCCERDSSTLAIFVVVIIIIVICCVFCCAFAIYRFILRKRTQGDQQGVEEVEVVEVDSRNHHNERSSGHHNQHRKRKGRGAGDSQDSTFTTSSYGGGGKYRQDEHSSSSQGKTNSGERDYHEQSGSHRPAQQNDEYDEYSESGYTAQSGRRDDDVMYDDVDAPETGFLDDATTASNNSGRSGGYTDRSGQPSQHRKYASNHSDHYYEEQYSARSGQSGQGGGKQRGVWNGDTSSAYFETPRSTRSNQQRTQAQGGGHQSRSPRTLARKNNSEDNLFNFDEDF